VSISQDSRSLLINKTDGEAQMLDIETRETIRIFNTGDRVGKYIIRASYGGANESFVTTGSDDGHIWIWHKDDGTLVEKLAGHEKGCCNSVSWNPTNPQMFASGGDDFKVRIWTNDDPRLKSLKGSRHSNGFQENGRVEALS